MSNRGLNLRGETSFCRPANQRGIIHTICTASAFLVDEMRPCSRPPALVAWQCPQRRTTDALAGGVLVDATTLFSEPRIFLQPIVSVSTGVVLAVEALARFADGTDTEAVFAAAHAAGHGPALEALCLRAALRVRADLPSGMLLAVNVSPDALRHIASMELGQTELRGVIVEVTEQDVGSPLDLTEHLADLRERGAAVAIDDVSSGYAGLLRLAQMRPDYVKVDRNVVSGVGDSAAQAAVLEALVTLSHRLGAAVIGEGVEDLADLYALGEFDVDYAQGYGVARPAPEVRSIDPAVIAACRTGRQRLLRGPSAVGHAAARTRDVYAVTAALAGAGHQDDIDIAIGAAAADLGVDLIGVSILASGLNLREIASTGKPLDAKAYSLTDYPATLAVFDGAGATEIQIADPDGDPAERARMEALGHASLLLVAVYDGDQTIGVLEFAQRTAKRWSAQDVAHAQGLAEHVSRVLKRLGVGAVPAVDSAR